MAVREVLRMGNPLLYKKAEPVTDFNSPELKSLIGDMFDTMRSLDGAGLAAPQIGVSQRVVIFGVEKNARYPDAEPVPTTILINPVITPLKPDMEEGWEGCLSVPGMRGLVPRYQSIRYIGRDTQGNEFERFAEGFHAVVVQHECDHLDGILYPMHIKDMKNFGFDEEVAKQKKEREA